jgi:hypothetical protein
VNDDGIVVYECLVGHRYSPEGILRAHYDTEERTLWAAVVGLEEAEKLVDAVAQHIPSHIADNVRQDGEHKREQADEVRRVLNELRGYRLRD